MREHTAGPLELRTLPAYILARRIEPIWRHLSPSVMEGRLFGVVLRFFLQSRFCVVFVADPFVRITRLSPLMLLVLCRAAAPSCFYPLCGLARARPRAAF